MWALSPRRGLLTAPFLLVGLLVIPMGEAASPAYADAGLAHQFTHTVRPFVTTYCASCHSGAAPAGQLNLSSYSTVAGVVQDFSRWTRVMERLSAGEMPPQGAPQPSAEARKQIADWIVAVRKNEARKHDGDPGVVLARRLSNSEYNYSIRDLIGQDIRPAKEFPVDPANQAGFDNSGESLDMSPALMNKYLQAAREVADHMFLKPDGFEFAPFPMLAETDRDKLYVQRIVAFYDRQDTDFAHYFQAAWRFKYRSVFGAPNATLADIAAERKVSPKYLAMVWQALNTKEDVGPMAKLQAMWLALPVPDANQPEIAAEGTAKMRDFVVRIRKDTFTVFTSPTVPGSAPGSDPDAPRVVLGGSGLSATSQPLLNMRNREFATHRRDFDRTALRVAGEAPPAALNPLLPDEFFAPPDQPVPGGRGAIAAFAPPPGADAPPTPGEPGAGTPAGIDPAAPPAGGRGRGGPGRAGAFPGRGGANPGRGGAPGRGGFVRPNPAAGLIKSRREDPDLDVPAGERARYEAAFARFSSVFPDAFYVRERGRAYPFENGDKGRLLSSGFHLVEGYTRDDIPLSELILDEKGKKELDGLWREFEFVADYTARTFVQFYFNQSGEVEGHGKESGSSRPPDKEVTSEPVVLALKQQYLAKAQGYPAATKAIEAHFDGVNATIRDMEKARLEAEPVQLNELLKFAARAYRRPLTAKERADLLGFYHSIREKQGLSHEDAFRDTIVSILMSPSFCYRIDLLPAAGATPRGRAANRVDGAPAKTSFLPVSRAASTSPSIPLPDYDLASRLSYFLWSSLPDEELLAHAAAGDLRRPAVLVTQTRRMLKDDRAAALATEFGGNWLGFRRFEEINSVDRERFPSFDNELREAMFQEPVRFIDDVVRNDRSVLDMIYGKYTFVNPVLAKHYSMPEVKGTPDQWTRVDNAADFGRGGLLTMAVFMTQNSPGLRTSPVKRGHWLVRNVLGEVIPPPPAVVPELPKDEAKMDLPLREVLAQHRANPVCGGCHSHFDVFGLTMEGYGPIGEKRANDLAGHPVDTQASFPGGAQGSGIEGLQAYIRANREKDFVDNLSRELLVYGIGRSLMISDDPLIERMKAKLAGNGYKFDTLVEAIVTSPQFLNRRNPDQQKGI